MIIPHRPLSITALVALLLGTSSVAHAANPEPLTETELLAPDGAGYDEFGRAVAISGDTLVVGVGEDDDFGSGDDNGAVYVFERDPVDCSWSMSAELGIDDAGGSDHLGYSVTLSEEGNILVAGAYGTDVFGNFSGAAFVFERDAPGGAWTQTARLAPDDGKSSDRFGWSVAISGSTLVAGTLPIYDWMETKHGWAYVFERDSADPTAWLQIAKFEANDGDRDDLFGAAVAISENLLLVGDTIDDNELGHHIGSVYVFERDPVDPTVWTHTTNLFAGDPVGNSWFGGSLAVSGDRVVVGAADVGAAYVFERDPVDPTAWIQVAKLVSPHATLGAGIGAAVAFSGDVVVAGDEHDPWNLDPDALSTGAAYVFLLDPEDPSVWRAVARLSADDPGNPIFEHYGEAVAIDGRTIVAGARRHQHEDLVSGAVYLYTPPTEGASAACR